MVERRECQRLGGSAAVQEHLRPFRSLVLPRCWKPTCRLEAWAAINDASHVKCFTFLHYRLSVEQNRLLPRNENKVACRSAADAISGISKALREAGLST